MIRPFLEAPRTSFTTHLPRPRQVSTSPSFTVRSPFMHSRWFMDTRPAEMRSAALDREVEKPAASTASSRRAATVSRRVLTVGGLGVRAERGISPTDTFHRPADSHWLRRMGRASRRATTWHFPSNIKMSPSFSRVMPRPMRDPRMSRWVREAPFGYVPSRAARGPSGSERASSGSCQSGGK